MKSTLVWPSIKRKRIEAGWGENVTKKITEAEARKKAILDAMSPRRQKYILNRVGYEKWDPFQEPKDPIDIRKDKTNRTSQVLVREFLQSVSAEEYSNAYGQAVMDMAIGLVNDDDRYIAMFEFSMWYKALLDRESIS